MEEFASILEIALYPVDLALSFLFFYFLFFFPKREGGRFSNRKIFILLLIFHAVTGIITPVLDSLAPDSAVSEIYSWIDIIVTFLIPFYIYPKQVYQNLFLTFFVMNIIFVYAMMSDIAIAMFDTGNEALTDIVQKIVYFIFFALTLPPLYFMSKRLYLIVNVESSRFFWKYIWVIPLCFLAFGFASYVAFLADFDTGVTFVISRFEVLAALIFIFYLLSRVLHEAYESAIAAERVRYSEGVVALQREQYGELRDSIDRARELRHDMRHHFAVLSGYLERGNYKGMAAYLRELEEEEASESITRVCRNEAVNALATHYLGQAKAGGVEVRSRMYVPEEACGVPDIDLCVIFGNLLENAIEACARQASGRKYISVRSEEINGYLVIVMDNSFDGNIEERKGIFLSRKRAGEGIGLSSVRSVCEKYHGMAQFHAEGNVFTSSVTLSMRGERVEAAQDADTSASALGQ